MATLQKPVNLRQSADVAGVASLIDVSCIFAQSRRMLLESLKDNLTNEECLILLVEGARH